MLALKIYGHKQLLTEEKLQTTIAATAVNTTLLRCRQQLRQQGAAKS